MSLFQPKALDTSYIKIQMCFSRNYLLGRRCSLGQVRQLNLKDDKLGDVEVAMVTLRGEVEEGKERVVILIKELDEERCTRAVQ